MRSRFQDPDLTAYLNRVVATAHGALYGAHPRSARQVVRFFGSRYRQAARQTAPFVLVAAVIVVVVTASTYLWVANSREARAGILPAAVQQAAQRAHGPNPNLPPAPALSSFIFLNNVQVTVLSFVGGITLGLWTLWVVIQNALLLGGLGGAAQAAGNAGNFWPLILPHGLLELTAICIGAGAGLRMGWSVIDPGDRPRTVSLVTESRDAVIAALGVIPALALAAFIEGFITPSGITAWVKISLGVVVALVYNLAVFGPPLRRRPPKAQPVPTAVPAT